MVTDAVTVGALAPSLFLCCEFCAFSAASQCTANHRTIKREESVNYEVV
jgi:hypothetical protein